MLCVLGEELSIYCVKVKCLPCFPKNLPEFSPQNPGKDIVERTMTPTLGRQRQKDTWESIIGHSGLVDKLHAKDPASKRVDSVSEENT